jgi:hypothetical protein
LRYQNKEWRLYVSDPEPMAVSVFRLTEETLKRATSLAITHEDGGKLCPRLGEKLWQWLLREETMQVELIEAAGLPSMFPKVAGARPNPNLGMNPPSIER